MDKKFFIGITIVTLLILVGGVWLVGVSDKKQQEKLSKPLIGEEIAAIANHVSKNTEIQYDSNPPAGGNHYGDSTTSAGEYDKAPADGYLVHSLEHGAVILWYKPTDSTDQSQLPEATDSAKANRLSKQDIDRLKQIFNSISVNKKIMIPRVNMNTPIAITSWGRLLKLPTIDESKIKTFFETNENRGPEIAPI